MVPADGQIDLFNRFTSCHQDDFRELRTQRSSYARRGDLLPGYFVSFHGEIAVTPKLFQRAADVSGQTLTEYVVSSAEAAAEAIIGAPDIIKLSARDSIAFVEALLNPPEPSATLRAAFDDYRAFIGE